MNIAFIGVGNMGRPMLANLLKKGFSAIAYDIVPAALDGAVALGAARASSPAEAAAAGDMVITILPSSGNVEAAYLGAGGIIEGVAPGRLCIDMSTIDPGTSQRVAARLQERGVRFLDAPVPPDRSGTCWRFPGKPVSVWRAEGYGSHPWLRPDALLQLGARVWSSVIFPAASFEK